MIGARNLLAAPKATPGEMLRQELMEQINTDSRKIVFIYAGAGYGKTTLLSQLARDAQYPVWMSLAGEADVMTFADSLCEAVRQTFPLYQFQPSEYLPFMKKENFISILANALIGSIEHLSGEIVLVLDDLHNILDKEIKELLSCLLRFAPENLRVLLGSREMLWPEFTPMKVRGNILELGQSELAFTEREVTKILGFFNGEIYRMTEGWPLAVGFFRVLLENGIAPAEVPSQGFDVLSTYLFYECISRLPQETADFLKCSACFDDLDAPMLDAVMKRDDSARILDSLTEKNLFTVKTGENHYHYHAMFRKSLLEMPQAPESSGFWRAAAKYYLERQDFLTAAKYVIKLNDQSLLKQIILKSYRSLLRSGSFSELRQLFQNVSDEASEQNADFLAAKGAYLSCIGNFTEAQKMLDRAIPSLDHKKHSLCMEALLHKARVLRNAISFQASDELLDRLLRKLTLCDPETACFIVVEKLYNLCWNCRISEAYTLAQHSMEQCARNGSLKIRSRLERFLTAVHFFEGNMQKAVTCYEKSLDLPEEDKEYLDMHGVGIYAAKAYQMLGNRERSIAVLEDALNQMKYYGKYEEMWAGYLFAAEIHFQNTFIDLSNGRDATYELAKKYFALADEYAPLYRKATYQQQWAQLQRLTYSIMFEKGEKKQAVKEIHEQLDNCNNYFKSIILARLMGYYASIHDITNAILCAQQCVAVGENTGAQLHSTLAYGILARCFLSERKWDEAKRYTALSLHHCVKNGIYEYFNALNDYGPVLQFAYDNGIEQNCLKQLMTITCYQTKKAYVQTFGDFAVYPFRDRGNPVKLRTKKERELFAFLLDAGERGVTKEQICTAIWSESESKNVMGLISVNLTQLKKDLAPLGIKKLILFREKRYMICRDNLVCDFDLLESIINEAGIASEYAAAKILSLYAGEYLSNFEALWSTAKRIRYHKLYEEAIMISRQK